MYTSNICQPCFQYENYGVMNTAFVLFWTFSSGLFFSFFLVSQLLYSPITKPIRQHFKSHISDAESDLQSESEHEIQYTDKYPISDSVGDIPASNTFIMENTPSGNVIMSYSQDEQAFLYWADSSISFSELETVARKYCNSFKCSQIYIPRNHTSQKDIHETQTDELEQQNESSPFATLKTYNYSNISSQRSCKFIHKDKIYAFQPLQSIPLSPNKKINFKDFKKHLNI